ncbi:HAMP domain-containing histidine kinase [Paenibacillus anaericanus]|uniref:histidine kinase n=1 Tax=Paenibacillus anaericanus TaxID=170367 RepID=A0A433XTX4_9BACL|nr:HAMP domain-containing sensor histidine kinase [Paenibacillus anaericanus]RUT37844.1 HAMP domain-containing histidine kinase [Paenibacillus anaericanus]
MYLNVWFRKWLIAVLICLVIIMGCGAGLLWDNYRSQSEADSQLVINKIRLQVSDMMLYLEQFNQELENDSKIRETIQAMSQKHQLSLMYVQLDGRIIFNSSPNTSAQQIDLKTVLHYDLYHARVDKDTYSIAFPVVDEVTQVQAGNAIFAMPASTVFVEKSHAIPLTLFIVMSTMLLILCYLMFIIRNKIKRDIIQPIYHLKDYTESIIKGNYEKKASYGTMNEIGEVYAMFDQMRLEIMYHSMRRDEQEKAQKELISNISHEIKTPLTTLKAYIEAIREGVCPDMPSVMEYVEIMHTNTDKMTRLTEDLLVHALQELGQISVTLTEQYSREMFLRILQPIGHFVRTTGVTYIEPTDIPNVLINADANRLEQVVSNLIANSLKHTSTGDSISVDIVIALGQLKITIADTGKGILPQDIPFVFDRYFKGKLNSSPRNEGFGLGLSICKHIIEAHNGSISFRSDQGQGTVFHCMIPLC